MKDGIDELKPLEDSVSAVVRQAAESSALKCHDGFLQAVASNELTEVIRVLGEISSADTDQSNLLSWNFAEWQAKQAAKYKEMIELRFYDWALSP